MSYTIENNRVITETIDGITMPNDYSFELVNDFVHSVDASFEELQALALGMSCELEKLKNLIKSDKLASSCQSIGQYRKMLLG